MTNINSAVLPGQNWPAQNWASRLGASSLPSAGFLGTSVPAAGPGAFLVDALPRVRGKVAVMVPQAQPHAVTALPCQANIDNYMTGVPAVGEGASGPPREQEPV